MPSQHDETDVPSHLADEALRVCKGTVGDKRVLTGRLESDTCCEYVYKQNVHQLGR